jgi:hypothetical protein
MTATELAHMGLRLIEHAILETIRERGPMQPSEVADALGLRRGPTGRHSDRGIRERVQSVGITFAVMKGMVMAGTLGREPLSPTESRQMFDLTAGCRGGNFHGLQRHDSP